MTTELERLVVKEGIEITAAPSKELPLNPYMLGWSAWDITLKAKGRRMKTLFFTAPGYAPRAADVIANLCVEAKGLDETGGTFEAWCARFGFNNDSRSAFATWKAISDTAPKTKQFLGVKYKQFAAARHV